jgi:hypothetical protein
MRDGYQRDSTRRHRLVSHGRRFQSLQLAPRGAVENIPTARAKLFPDRVGCVKVPFAPALDAFS